MEGAIRCMRSEENTCRHLGEQGAEDANGLDI